MQSGISQEVSLTNHIRNAINHHLRPPLEIKAANNEPQRLRYRCSVDRGVTRHGPMQSIRLQTASMRRRRIESTTGMRPGWPGRAGDFALSWSKMDSFSSVETKLERDYA
jgi:hypothetical protein